ncbi:MAG: hypothetical protein ACUVX8_18775 [Candidatus Zipacnadales bacterium]
MVAVLLSLFFHFPSYDVFWTGDYLNSWRPVLEKFNNPTMDMSSSYDADSHASKLTWRLTVPLIAHFLKLDVAGALLLQFAAGVLLLYFVCGIAHEVTGNRVTSALVTLGVASIYAGTTSFAELRGIFDGVALALMAGAMFFDNPLAVGGGLFLAYWTDERALVASPLVFMYHLIRGVKRHSSSISIPLVVLMTWLVYGAVRAYLTWQLRWVNSIGGMGLFYFLRQINLLPFGIWTGLEGEWLFVLLALLVLFRKRAWSLLLAFGFSILLVIAVSLSVVDITRSMAYLLPALLVALSVLARIESEADLRVYAAVAFLLSLAWPGYYAGGRSTIWWQYPLPIQLLRWVLGRTG